MWAGPPQDGFRTFKVDPKDLGGRQVDNPRSNGLRRGRDTMLYPCSLNPRSPSPCSPTLQSLPVPGIGFCQTILADQGAVVRSHGRLWPFTPAPISTDRTPREAADVAAIAYQLH